MNSRKILGSTLTVASLTITALAGTPAFAVDNAAPSAVQSVATENSQNLPDIRVRYVPKTIVLDKSQLSNDSFPAHFALKPEFYNAKTVGVVQAPASKDVSFMKDSVISLDELFTATVNQETGEIDLSVGQQLPANRTFTFHVTTLYENGTSESVPVTFTVVAPGDENALAAKNNPEYVAPTEEAWVSGGKYTPLKDFTLKNPPATNDVASYEVTNTIKGWNATVDQNTGTLKVSLADTAKPVIGAGVYTYIVEITYADGSVDYATAPFAYTNYDSDGLFLDFVYAGEHYLKAGEQYSAEPQFWTQGMTGERVDGPDGVTYEVIEVTNPNIEASIDSKSNMLNYRFVSGKDGDSGTITVRVHYKDGGTEDYNFDVEIGEDPYPSYPDLTADDIIEMWYGDNQVPVVAGQNHTRFPVFYVPVL